jgi:hypothetical protein
MLLAWIMEGFPPLLSLHLLQNPTGLLHALRESFSFKLNVTLDKVLVKATLVSDSDTSDAKLHQNLQTLSEKNNGCSVLATNIRLVHGNLQLLSNGNMIVSQLPMSVTSSSATITTLQIYAAIEESEAALSPTSSPFLKTCDTEIHAHFHFPIFATPEIPPSNLSLLSPRTSTGGGSFAGNNINTTLWSAPNPFYDEEALLFVPLPCTEDSEDQVMLDICFRSSSMYTL